MSELYMMATISDRNQTRRFLAFYKEYGVTVTLLTFGRGTAASEILDSFGLEAAEKAVQFAFVTGAEWKKIKYGLEKQIKIDIPGSGIAFIVPLSSIGGKKQLQFLTEGREFEKGEESTLKDTKYELLVVIANQGYTDMIMDAAREAKAAGGTVIHAKGTGSEKAQKFLGVSIAEEKEMIFMVTRREGKNAIMKAIMEKAGLDSKARSIVFSLPVTETAGMRLIEETEGAE
ncbi:MAG: P-II family nitrogen regulator [Lachnospiraceae bacterium]|nr:P-II family nitrogen regulator [Lachnospiraceae bacterium]MDO5550212.1 P-II family nitrogen regulator [Lachnospiraceae bacterium]